MAIEAFWLVERLVEVEILQMEKLQRSQLQTILEYNVMQFT